MARQVLPIVGAVVGAYFGGPAGAQFGYALGSFIGNAVDPQIIKGPSLGDGAGQTAEEGAYRPVVFGTAVVGGNIIHRGPAVIITNRESQGKGGGPTVETERRLRTFAIRIGEPIAGILRIWMDEKLVFDIRPDSLIPEETLEFADLFRFYSGLEDQLPDPALEAYLGVGNVNAYRGTSYVVFDQFDLTDYADRIPNFRFEVMNGASDEYNFFYPGGQSFPSVVELPTGVAASIIRIEMGTGSAPDKMTISDGVINPVDTGYVGTSILQPELNAALAARGLPPEPIGSGTYTVPNPDLIGGLAYFVVVYVSKVFGPSSLPINIWAPLGGTGWEIKATAISGGPNPVLLSNIITWLHDRVGSYPDIFDASEMTDLLDGLVLAGSYSAADCIRTLMPIYMFDSSEHDRGDGYKINYIKRGKPVHATLTIDDLVSAPEQIKRADSFERPRVLHLHFQSPITGYAPAKATARRNSPDVKVTGEISTNVPVTFSDVDEAWKIADKLLKISWAEVSGKQELTLAENWLELVPTDVIGLVLRDTVQRLRIVKHQISAGEIACELVADQQSAYTSNLTGIALPEPTPPPPSIVGETIFEFLDIPALNDNNDRLLYYTAASGQNPAWYGATVQRSLDGGANFENTSRHIYPTIIGELVAPITSASQHYTDTTNVVAVQLFTDITIHSLTQQQFLSEGGAFALAWSDGGTERWEILQYRDAEQHEDGYWLLSTLLRGRLNTLPAAHFVGARFVLLDAVMSVDALTSFINSQLAHRAVSFGRSPESAVQESQIYTAQSQTEWPVAHLFLSRDGDTINCSTVPRHRFGTEDNPVRSVNWSGYRWIATDGVNSISSDTLIDSISFDVAGWSSLIEISVAQLNRITGAGPSVSAYDGLSDSSSPVYPVMGARPIPLAFDGTRFLFSVTIVDVDGQRRAVAWAEPGDMALTLNSDSSIPGNITTGHDSSVVNGGFITLNYGSWFYRLPLDNLFDSVDSEWESNGYGTYPVTDVFGTFDFTNLAYSGDRVFTFDLNDKGIVFAAENGIDFSEPSTIKTTGMRSRVCKYVNGLYVVGGQIYKRAAGQVDLLTSPDLITFTVCTFGLSIPGSVLEGGSVGAVIDLIEFDGEMLAIVLVNQGSDIGYNLMRSSDDGAAWVKSNPTGWSSTDVWQSFVVYGSDLILLGKGKTARTADLSAWVITNITDANMILRLPVVGGSTIACMGRKTVPVPGNPSSSYIRNFAWMSSDGTNFYQLSE